MPSNSTDTTWVGSNPESRSTVGVTVGLYGNPDALASSPRARRARADAMDRPTAAPNPPRIPTEPALRGLRSRSRPATTRSPSPLRAQARGTLRTTAPTWERHPRLSADRCPDDLLPRRRVHRRPDRLTSGRSAPVRAAKPADNSGTDRGCALHLDSNVVAFCTRNVPVAKPVADCEPRTVKVAVKVAPASHTTDEAPARPSSRCFLWS